MRLATWNHVGLLVWDGPSVSSAICMMGMPISIICSWAACTTGWLSADRAGMLHSGNPIDSARMPNSVSRLKRKKSSFLSSRV